MIEDHFKVHLVRHGRPLIDSAVAAHEWGLDPGAQQGLLDLRTSCVLPSDAAWFSSPEPKARATAAALTELPITIVSDLREMARPAAWYEQDEFVAMATRAFANPDEPASAEWETARSTTHRVSQAVQAIVAANLTNVVLVGHGTAWTLLVSILTATPPDVVAWHRMLFPDHLSIAGARVDSGWGAWTT